MEKNKVTIAGTNVKTMKTEQYKCECGNIHFIQTEPRRNPHGSKWMCSECGKEYYSTELKHE